MALNSPFYVATSDERREILFCRWATMYNQYYKSGIWSDISKILSILKKTISTKFKSNLNLFCDLFRSHFPILCKKKTTKKPTKNQVTFGPLKPLHLVKLKSRKFENHVPPHLFQKLSFQILKIYVLYQLQYPSKQITHKTLIYIKSICFIFNIKVLQVQWIRSRAFLIVLKFEGLLSYKRIFHFGELDH